MGEYDQKMSYAKPRWMKGGFKWAPPEVNKSLGHSWNQERMATACMTQKQGKRKMKLTVTWRN